MRADLHKNVCRRFIHNSQNGKDTKYPSTAEKIIKLCHIRTMELYSAIKKNHGHMEWYGEEAL